MKTQTGLWIDSTQAIIVRLINHTEHITEIQSDIENPVHHRGEGDKGSFMGSRHINQEGKFDEKKKNQIDHYLHKVIEFIQNDDEFYIFGPAEIKSKLKHKIEEDKLLAHKLKAVEPADSMTNPQIVAHVNVFYHEVVRK